MERNLLLENENLREKIHRLESMLCNQEIKDCQEKTLNILTSKEKQIAHLMALGYENEEIAEKMEIALVSIGQYISSIYRKIGTGIKKGNRVKLALIVLQVEVRLL